MKFSGGAPEPALTETVRSVIAPQKDAIAPQSPDLPASLASKKPGRKTKIAKMTIEEAENAISAQLPTLLDRLMDLANGVLCAVIESHVEHDSETGEERIVPEQRVYRMPPDKDALKYLTERVLGRVPQRVELSGKVDQTFKVIPWMPREEAEQKKLVAPLKIRTIEEPARVIDG